MPHPRLRWGIAYHQDVEAAQAERDALPDDLRRHARLRLFGLGWAVQLHVSGPYLGPDLEPERHHCRWCPEGAQNPRSC